MSTKEPLAIYNVNLYWLNKHTYNKTARVMIKGTNNLSIVSS